MKICPETARLTALREGWLDSETAGRLRQHLEECEICRAVQGDLDALVAAVDSLPTDAEPPPGGWDALLEATMKMRDRTVPSPPPARSGWLKAAVAVAAILFIAVTAIMLIDSPASPQRVTAGIEEEDELHDQLLAEHALASDLVPFSDSTTLLILANSGRR